MIEKILEFLYSENIKIVYMGVLLLRKMPQDDQTLVLRFFVDPVGGKWLDKAQSLLNNKNAYNFSHLNIDPRYEEFIKYNRGKDIFLKLSRVSK